MNAPVLNETEMKPVLELHKGLMKTNNQLNVTISAIGYRGHPLWFGGQRT